MSIIDDIMRIAKPIKKIGEKAAVVRNLGRERVIATLKNAIILIDNPAHVVAAGSKTRKPYKCFAIYGDDAEVWLSYARRPLPIKEGVMGLSVPASKLKDAINLLTSGVAEGEFDDQINKAMAGSPHRGRPKKRV